MKSRGDDELRHLASVSRMQRHSRHFTKQIHSQAPWLHEDMAPPTESLPLRSYSLSRISCCAHIVALTQQLPVFRAGQQTTYGLTHSNVHRRRGGGFRICEGAPDSCRPAATALVKMVGWQCYTSKAQRQQASSEGAANHAPRGSVLELVYGLLLLHIVPLCNKERADDARARRAYVEADLVGLHDGTASHNNLDWQEASD